MVIAILIAVAAVWAVALIPHPRWTVCGEYGCSMKHIGGRNAGCSSHCCCSVPVYSCPICGDSDYGDNDEARDVLLRCSGCLL